MLARITFEVENPNEEANKKQFEQWINYQIGKNVELPYSPLTNYNLELMDAFADKEIVENATVEIIESNSGGNACYASPASSGVQNGGLLQKAKIMNECLENINTIMWESFMIKGRGFGREEGEKIMEQLNNWAEHC